MKRRGRLLPSSGSRATGRCRPHRAGRSPPGRTALAPRASRGRFRLPARTRHRSRPGRPGSGTTNLCDATGRSPESCSEPARSWHRVGGRSPAGRERWRTESPARRGRSPASPAWAPQLSAPPGRCPRTRRRLPGRRRGRRRVMSRRPRASSDAAGCDGGWLTAFSWRRSPCRRGYALALRKRR